MSRDAKDDEPPRRPKSSKRRPVGDEGPSTFRPDPLPGRAGSSSASSSSSRKRARTVDDVKGPTLWERVMFGSVGTAQLAVFCRQLSAYLNSGVDLLKALTSLERQFSKSALGPVLGRIIDAVRRGDELGEAVAREPQAFDPLFISMMRVAETRGGVPETLRRMSIHYENRLSLLRQARSALIYPVSVLLIASAVVALITIYLLPMFIALLKDVAGRGALLPWPSRALMAFSDFVQWMGWWLLPLAAVGIPFLFFRARRTRIGKQLTDRIALRIPVLGLLLRKLDTTRFARTLGALLESGVEVGLSLDLTADVMQLEPFRRAVQIAKDEVMNGGELSTALFETKRFGPDVIAVINSGEETGKLPESLEHLADDYEEQVAYMVKNMGQLIQPLLMIVLGGIVLFIILAVMLPYISIITSLTR